MDLTLVSTPQILFTLESLRYPDTHVKPVAWKTKNVFFIRIFMKLVTITYEISSFQAWATHTIGIHYLYALNNYILNQL
jgi:hypothetical protein